MTKTKWEWVSFGIDVLIGLLVVGAIYTREWGMAQVGMLLLILSELAEIRRRI